MIIRQIYILILGVLLALFVSVGIITFYPEPQPPKPIQMTAPVMIPKSPTDIQYQNKLVTDQNTWQKNYAVYQNDLKSYNRNYSIILVLFSVLFLVLSLTILRTLSILADGFLLGSLFTLAVSIFKGFSSDDNTFRFLMVTIALLITMLMGYLKFVKNPQQKYKK